MGSEEERERKRENVWFGLVWAAYSYLTYTAIRGVSEPGSSQSWHPSERDVARGESAIRVSSPLLYRFSVCIHMCI